MKARSGGGRPCAFFFQAEDGIRDDLVTGVQTCALPICTGPPHEPRGLCQRVFVREVPPPARIDDARGLVDQVLRWQGAAGGEAVERDQRADRKSTRLNSSHQIISYAVFCLKKKKNLHSGTCAASREAIDSPLTTLNTIDLSFT